MATPSFILPAALELTCSAPSSACLDYAIQEAVRLLARLGAHAQSRPAPVVAAGACWLTLTAPGAPPPTLPTTVLPHQADGYLLHITPSAVTIAARSAKGVLNGVYDLAERLGFLFLLPGAAGEWLAPAPDGGRQLPAGDTVMTPRFAHRGVFWEPLQTKDYTVEEWLRFYAKLRFNAVDFPASMVAVGQPIADTVGLRLEVGGHGMRDLMPRELFATEPALFRMFQPEDFGGKRTADSNCCVTHPRTKQIMQDNYRQRLANVHGVHAIHCWADDLPAGGWCMCPSCRALVPADQAMLAMRHLAEVARQATPPVRVPVIAYHDTLFPGALILPTRECFLLFAPRERCYGHALDDPSCARNRHYRQALDAWMQQFAGIDDAHTFEYYFDQILFRGLYPFLPGIIIDDMRVYEQAGITTHLSLQVAGPAIAPEFNMLVFARAHWDATLTADGFVAWLTRQLGPGAASWQTYLEQRAALFTAAMAMCDHELGIYLDYRWLPETTRPFGQQMASRYAAAAAQLTAALAALEQAVSPDWPAPLQRLVAAETGRARFEVAELTIMAHQQTAMNLLGRYLSTGDLSTRTAALAALQQAIAALRAARSLALAAGITEDGWYCPNVNGWLTREFTAKIARYDGAA